MAPALRTMDDQSTYDTMRMCHGSGSKKVYRIFQFCVYIIVITIVTILPSSNDNTVHSARLFKAWTDNDWCTSIFNPQWPMAYAKKKGQSMEFKGRVASNLQQFGHECKRRGVTTKCYVWEDIACSIYMNETCIYIYIYIRQTR